MKSEVVLIAKFFRIFDALEWVRHYTRLGFDHITIYDNNTSCFDVSSLMVLFPNLTVCKIMGKPSQCEVYNNHRMLHREYDWQFFCDDDEFLYIDKKKFNNVNEFLASLPPFIQQFGVYWKYMSYAGGQVPEDRPVTRMTEDMMFTDNAPYLTHIKSFVKNTLNPVDNRFDIPHLIYNVPTYTIDGPAESASTIRNPFDDYISLHHYYRRSKAEFKEKMERNRIDADLKYKDYEGQNEYEKDHKYDILDSRILL